MPHDDDQTDQLFDDNNEQKRELTADEIGERAVDRYFEDTWGPKTANVPLTPEQSDYARLHQSAGTMHISGLVHIADVTEALIAPEAEEAPAVRPKIPAELLQRRDEIIKLAVKVYESEDEVVAWLDRSLRTFNGKSARDLLRTLDGCDQAEVFLRSLYPDRHY